MANLRWWTIKRATGIGVSFALASLLFWPFHGGWSYLLWPQAFLAAIVGLSGLSIIFITLADLRQRGYRSDRLRPLRAFDIAVAAMLIGFAFIQLEALSGELAVGAVTN